MKQGRIHNSLSCGRVGREEGVSTGAVKQRDRSSKAKKRAKSTNVTKGEIDGPTEGLANGLINGLQW